MRLQVPELDHEDLGLADREKVVREVLHHAKSDIRASDPEVAEIDPAAIAGGRLLIEIALRVDSHRELVEAEDVLFALLKGLADLFLAICISV